MEKFVDIYHRAAARKGGEDALASLLPSPLTAKQIASISDDKWLEEFTRKVFQSGFYWAVIEKKWPGFREVFWQFDVEKMLLIPPEMLEQKASDERIVRNYNKVKTIPVNAQMVYDISKQHGSFGQFIANWPSEDMIGLWAILKKQGSRLGGNTGPFALRAMGVDTFLLSRDVESYLRRNEIIDGGLQTKRSLSAIQAFFNQMQQQSGKTLQDISKIISFSCGDNHVGIS